MTRTPHCRRPGLSLTEVLVALFVMALGIISLMTLFPLGAVQMGQALRDDRCGQTASQADGVVRLWWQTEVVEPPTPTSPLKDPFFAALDTNTLGTPVPIDSPAPSYPIFVDPIGYFAKNLNQRLWVGNFPAAFTPTAGDPRIRRFNMQKLINPTLAIRACSMMDDITFDEFGKPDTLSVPGTVVREGAFNWCAVIQRPNNSNRYVADLKICVFHTKGLYGGHRVGAGPADEERVYPPQPPTPLANTPGLTRLTLGTAIGDLPIRSGSWVMDGSNGTVTNFYRIQSITETGATTTDLELDTPLKSTVTQLYIIRGLADVFDRPQLTASGYSRLAP